MNPLYPFFVAFSMIFFAELGDKTQLLVLSFSAKNRAYKILLGVALGTFFSHGIAILFGSKLASFSSLSFQFYLKLFTYCSFIIFGIIGFFSKNQISDSSKVSYSSKKSKTSFFNKLSHLSFNVIIIIAIFIIIGELGDKTFLASLGLGLEYSSYRFSLVCGSILGMVMSNLLAVFCGKFLSNHLKPSFVSFLSNLIFLVFGLFGIFSLFF